MEWNETSPITTSDTHSCGLAAACQMRRCRYYTPSRAGAGDTTNHDRLRLADGLRDVVRTMEELKAHQTKSLSSVAELRNDLAAIEDRIHSQQALMLGLFAVLLLAVLPAFRNSMVAQLTMDLKSKSLAGGPDPARALESWLQTFNAPSDTEVSAVRPPNAEAAPQAITSDFWVDEAADEPLPSASCSRTGHHIWCNGTDLGFLFHCGSARSGSADCDACLVHRRIRQKQWQWRQAPMLDG